MTMAEVLNSVQYMVDEDGKRTAAVIHISTWKNLLHILNDSEFTALNGIEDVKTSEQVIADVRGRPVNPDAVMMPKGSLLDALQNPTYDNEDFDLDEWTQQWSVVEREMKAITYQNDVAEGRA